MPKFLITIPVLLLVKFDISSCVQGGHPIAETVLYMQPAGAVPIAEFVWANPKPWPLPNMTNKTNTVFWQRNHSDARVESFSGQLSPWTGTVAAPGEQGIAAHATSAPIPWSAVQYTSDGIWGAALNTSGAYEALSTTTIESTFGETIDIWSNGGKLTVELELEVPYAFKESPANDCAVYVSLSVYVVSKEHKDFIWYSTNLFDWERDVTNDHVFIDTVSRKLIISGPLSGHSVYNTMHSGSALASNTTIPKLMTFAYDVTAAHVEQGIRDGLKAYPTHLPSDLPLHATEYGIAGFNVELEATPGAGAGLSMRGLRITRT